MSLEQVVDSARGLPPNLREDVVGYARSVQSAIPEIFRDAGIAVSRRNATSKLAERKQTEMKRAIVFVAVILVVGTRASVIDALQQKVIQEPTVSSPVQAQSQPVKSNQTKTNETSEPTAVVPSTNPVAAPSPWFAVTAAVLPTAIWPLLIVGLLVAFRREARDVLQATIRRIRRGAAVKLGAIELGAIVAMPSRIEKLEKGRAFRPDDDDRRQRERRDYYDRARRVMLVHKLLPSTETGELYDILIYVMPSRKGSLLSVQRVEYYFGGYGWQHKVFIASDRARAFPVLTAAYGPFLCTAELFFVDGESVMLHRYIDFEMGDAVVESGTSRG